MKCSRAWKSGEISHTHTHTHTHTHRCGLYLAVLPGLVEELPSSKVVRVPLEVSGDSEVVLSTSFLPHNLSIELHVVVSL